MGAEERRAARYHPITNPNTPFQTASCNGGPSATSQQVAVDSQVSGAKLQAKKTQRQSGENIKVKAKVGAADAVTVVLSGKVKVSGAGKAKTSFGLKKVIKHVAAGKLAKATLKVKGKSGRSAIADALAAKAKVKAKLNAKFTDAAGK